MKQHSTPSSMRRRRPLSRFAGSENPNSVKTAAAASNMI